jgi:hypothetical protein
VIALLGAGLAGALAGALAGVVIVDYTDAYANHTAIDLAVVAVCALAGLVLAMLVRASPRRDGPGAPAGLEAGRDPRTGRA